MKKIKKNISVFSILFLLSLNANSQSFNSDFFGYSLAVSPPLNVIENKYQSLYIRMQGATPKRDMFGNLIVPDIVMISPLPVCDLATIGQNFRNGGQQVVQEGGVLMVFSVIMDMKMTMIFLASNNGNGLVFTLMQHENFSNRIETSTLSKLIESVKFKTPTASVQAMINAMNQAGEDAKGDTRIKKLVEGIF